MSGSPNTIQNRLGKLGFFARLSLLSALLALAWVLVSPFAYELGGPDALFASGVAAGVCWIGAAAALALASFFPAGSLPAMGVAMLVRMLLPLALGVTLHLQVPQLARDGMIFYLLVFYLVALATETALAVAQISSANHSHKAT
jgi:hypothetical protein